MEAALARFQAANTQVLGVSVDSRYSHAAWAANLGGVSFPLLADFHPKGAVASAFGFYLDEIGIADRATVIIDSNGVVQFAESVGPDGQRDIGGLAAACERVAASSSTRAPAFGSAPGLPAGCVLYVRDHCGASRSTLWARDNLHLADSIALKNVSRDAAAAAELEKISGGKRAPCLVVDGEPILESDAIVGCLIDRCATPLG